MAGPFIPGSEGTAYAVGATITWSSGGVSYSGTVVNTPTTLKNGSPNYGAGEPVYEVTETVGNQTTVYVRQSEILT